MGVEDIVIGDNSVVSWASSVSPCTTEYVVPDGCACHTFNGQRVVILVKYIRKLQKYAKLDKGWEAESDKDRPGDNFLVLAWIT